MKLPWQKDDRASVSVVKGRAAVVPRSYKFMWSKGTTSNNFTVNSYSTIITTVKVLQEGETAESTADWAPGTINFGVEKFSLEEIEAQGLQRVQFDAPNWVSVIVTQDGGQYIAHVELPVWIDAATGKIQSVNVPALVAQLEPRREQLSKIWGVQDGPFAELHQIIQAPKEIIKTGKYLASIPGELFGGVKELFDEHKAAHAPFPPEKMPDLSQYPPVDGIDFDSFVLMCARPENVVALGKTQEEFMEAAKTWKERLKGDAKLVAFIEYELKRVMREAPRRGRG